MSAEFDRIVSKDTKLEELGTGYQPAEGPIWIAKGNYLIFSSLRGNEMFRWSKKDGVTIFRTPARTNGNTLDRQGRLITCEHRLRTISRTEADGTVVTVASHYKGKRFNSPNDIIVKRSDGAIYFTDPPYGLMIEGAIDKKELDFCGVFRISPDGKDVTLLSDDFARPNGLCFSPDESLLYINDTERMHVRVFDVKKDGTITNGRLLVNVEGDPEKGRPDGLKVDPQGNVYCTGPGGILVYTPAGKYLGKIEVPKKVANFAWGESDWKTLFLTCFDGLYRLRMNVKGIPLP